MQRELAQQCCVYTWVQTPYQHNRHNRYNRYNRHNRHKETQRDTTDTQQTQQTQQTQRDTTDTTDTTDTKRHKETQQTRNRHNRHKETQRDTKSHKETQQTHNRHKETQQKQLFLQFRRLVNDKLHCSTVGIIRRCHIYAISMLHKGDMYATAHTHMHAAGSPSNPTQALEAVMEVEPKQNGSLARQD